jgi:4-amino-4-deoxy-L-arabinose transferase-like glycosyltransferase
MASNNSTSISRILDQIRAKPPRYFVLLILAALLLFGFILTPDFGESVDEWPNSYYGELFLNLYNRGKLFRDPQIEYYHGPFYMMVFTITSRFFTFAFPNWLLADGRHFTNFITFLIGGYFLFTIALRFLPKRAAWLSFFLYLFHPLLFGHAFINQKDTPFMSFFLITIAAGFRALDQWTTNQKEFQDSEQSSDSLKASLIKDWNQRSILSRITIILTATTLILLLIDLWSETIIYPTATSLISNAYSGRAIPWIQTVFDRIAEDAYKTPLALYLGKFDTAFLWLRFIFSILAFGTIFWLLIKLFKITYSQYFKLASQRLFIILVAGAVLGLTTSIRIIGPLAGFMVSVIFLTRLRQRAFAPLAAYWAAAVLFVYLTWPVLWGNPISQMFERVLAISSFRGHYILYRGEYFQSGSTPWHYLPTLFAIQCTIPFFLLLITGILGKIIDLRRKGFDELTFILTPWILIPVIFASLGLMPVYNNTRHLLFIFPAFVLLAGIGVEYVFKQFPNRSLQIFVSTVVLLPGIIAIYMLHPYQYIYYNQFVGGLDGAVGRYQLDYWCTSMRQSADYLNANAPPNSKVAVSGAVTTIKPFLRDDLHLYVDRRGESQPDYGVHCIKGEPVDNMFVGLELVSRVAIGDVVLSIVEQK